MLFNLLGYRQLDFQGKNGEQIRGSQLFVSYEQPDVKGLATDKLFIKPEIAIPKGVEIGKQLNINFNMKGKPESVTLP